MTESQWQQWFAGQLRGLREDLNTLTARVATKDDLHEAVKEAIEQGNLRHTAFHERHLRMDHVLPIGTPPRRNDDPDQVDMRPVRSSESLARKVWVMWGVGIFLLVIIAEQVARLSTTLLETYVLK